MSANRIAAIFAAATALVVTLPARAAMPTTTQARAAEAGGRLFKQKRYAEAISEYDKVLAADPKNAVALTMRGFTKAEVSDYPSALRDFDGAWELAPESPNAWSNACWARALANVDLDLAQKLCDGAIKSDPANSKFYDTRGFLGL